jgi:protein-disulfide isomerase
MAVEASVNQERGAVGIVAALIIGLSLVGSALILRSSIVDATQEVAALTEALASGRLAANPPSRPSARPSQPEPSRRYSVDTKGSPSKGNPRAKLAIVEFSDFQCPYCARVIPTLKQIEDEYGGKVRIVFKHLPLSNHSKAPDAHAAAEAAHRQGRFWEMHDLIFANQRTMSPERYLEYAEQIGLDIARFNEDLASAQVQAKIASDTAEAERLMVNGTPGFFVNGRFLSGAQPFSAFKKLIDEELGRV